MMEYSKEKAHHFLRSRIKLIDRANRKWSKQQIEGNNSINKILLLAKINRSIFLYLNRRLLLSHKTHIESLAEKLRTATLNMCIYNIKEIKVLQLKYAANNSKGTFTTNEKRYLDITVNTLKKYYYLRHYKDIIIAISLRRKFNGQEDICRLIQSYI